jgi:chromate transporter
VKHGFSRLAEVIRLFLRLGMTAFGGPAVHLSLMEEEVVRRRGWLTHGELMDLVSATNLIPGPNSTELAIHIGYRRAGLAGLVAAGVCFIFPAAIITSVLAWAYVRFGYVPAAAGVLHGIQAAVLAVIVGAIARLGRTTFRDWFFAAVSLAAAAASLAGANELLILLGAGLLGAARVGAKRWKSPGPGASLGACALLLPGVAAAGVPGSAGLLELGAFFLKVGSVLYGSGYVLLAFLRNGLVADHHWLTEAQLLDAIAVGQFTPGPLLATATFIGFLLQSWAGAAVATVAIFLPSFVFVLLTTPWIPKMRASATLGALLDGVNAASLGLMAAVVLQLGSEALRGWTSWIIAAASALGTIFTRLNPTWFILAGGAFGLAVEWAQQLLSG